MFLLDWIERYINTPPYQLTLMDDILFLGAISIIALLIIGGIFIGWFIGAKIKKIIDNRKRRQ